MLKKLRLSAEDWMISHNLKKLTMCKKCYTFYYKNSWHLERPEYLDKDYEVDVPVHFTECLACMEQEQASYDMESGLVLQ